MPVVRRGEVPYPPQGMGEYADELYTIQGFFGDWVHVYRHHNAGIPKRWSDDALMYAGIDLTNVTPSDLTDPRGTATTLLEGDGVGVSLSRRAQPMPFAERNLDAHQIRFYHRGTFLIETELGELTADEGDFVVIGKGLTYRERPATSDNFVLVFETAEPIVLAERLWDSVGYASLFVDYSGMTLPEPAPSTALEETEVRVRYEGAHHTFVYDFDPCRDVIGWVGDPVIFKLNISSVPGIGTARGFLPPPAHAVLMSDSKSFFFNVLSPGPFPSVPEPGGSFGAPAHLNDYDELWLNHASRFSPDTQGHLWLFPRTLPHPGMKRPPRFPPNPPRELREVKINFDTRAKLRWTADARRALIPGDVRETVFTSMYGVPPQGLPEDVRRVLE